MAVFNYKAREKDGAIVSGTIEAAERRLAMQCLQAKGLSPVTLKEGATGAPSALARLGERAKALRSNRSEKDGNEKRDDDDEKDGDETDGDEEDDDEGDVVIIRK